MKQKEGVYLIIFNLYYIIAIQNSVTFNIIAKNLIVIGWAFKFSL